MWIVAQNGCTFSENNEEQNIHKFFFQSCIYSQITFFYLKNERRELKSALYEI